MIVRLPYVQRLRDRHGKVRHYFRRPGFPRVTLPGQPGTPEFLAAYQRAAANAPSAPAPRSATGSLSALIASWYASARFRQLAPTTQAVYRRIAERMREKYGANPVVMLAATNVRKIVADRSDTPAAANHLLRMFRSLLDHAVDEKLIGSNPAREVKRLKERGRGIHTWTEEEIGQFEAYWPSGSRPRLALALLLYTGQRRSDVVRMGRQHIRGGMIEVRQQKTQTELKIPLHAALQAELAQLPHDHLTLLVTRDGAAFTSNGFYMRFQAWAAEAGLPTGRSPHGLRKAAARRLAEAGCSAHQIMSITGHRTLAEAERYTRAANQTVLAQAAVSSISGFTAGSAKSLKIKSGKE